MASEWKASMALVAGALIGSCATLAMSQPKRDAVIVSVAKVTPKPVAKVVHMPAAICDDPWSKTLIRQTKDVRRWHLPIRTVELVTSQRYNRNLYEKGSGEVAVGPYDDYPLLFEMKLPDVPVACRTDISAATRRLLNQLGVEREA